MKTMKALLKTTPAETAIQEVPIPEPRAHQVLVKVSAAALCGTDLHVFHWNSWAQQAGIQLPLVMGHECCGEVAALGDPSLDLQPGDRVVVETHIPCGSCYQCLNGQQHICSNLQLFGLHVHGCFSEYALVPSVCARKIPEAISCRVGALMGPLGTALRSVHETDVGGATVLVIGCGPIGLFAVASAAALGAARIIATDVSPSRLQIAAQMGAEIRLNPLEDAIKDEVLAASGGYGADVCIDASGSVEAIRQGFHCLRKGGRISLIGLPDRPMELDLGREVVFKEAKIFGIHGRTMFETWTRMENLLASGKLDVLPSITHVLPLDSWRECMDLATRGAACKVILEP